MTAVPPDEGLEATPAAALKAKIAELEDALDAAHEDVIILRNENQSLRTSLDLIANENVRLSHHLEERDAEALKVRSRIEQLKTLLRVAEGYERTATVAATDEKSNRTAGSQRAAAKPHEISTEKLLGGTITF